MRRVKVAGFSLSLDGFGAGPEQSLQDPLGKRGRDLHRWFFGTKTFKAMDGFGALILWRNMFGPVRGGCPDAGVASTRVGIG